MEAYLNKAKKRKKERIFPECIIQTLAPTDTKRFIKSFQNLHNGAVEEMNVLWKDTLNNRQLRSMRARDKFASLQEASFV
jgi:hypothetical protein